MKNKFIVFDLDDTLYSEIDYLKSAYSEIASIVDSDQGDRLYLSMMRMYFDKKNVFEFISKVYPDYTIEILLKLYREHIPNIKLRQNVIEVLNLFVANDYKLGLLTDGRSKTQRNKINQLSIDSFFSKIVISEEFGTEKPCIDNFEVFMKDGDFYFYYIADNPQKDFISPNKLGWFTVCLLDDGNNVNKQDFLLPIEMLPKAVVSDFKEILDFV
jgi:putative hydrolase of the HAD superfamily